MNRSTNARTMKIMLMTTTIALLITAPSAATFFCGGAQLSGSINPGCATRSDAVASIPCGITGRDACQFQVDSDFGCHGAIGQNNVETWIAFQWPSKPPNCAETLPTTEDCDVAEASASPCHVESTDVRTCPDPDISGYCEFPCDDQTPARVPELWTPTCRAVALMEWGWRDDPSKIAMGGFFNVGALLPEQDRQGAPYPVRHLGGYDVLSEMDLVTADDTVLGPVGWSPRWGAQNGPVSKWGEVKTDWKALEAVGICQNPQGLVFSPHWTLLGGYLERRPILATCDGNAADPSGRDMRPYFNSFGPGEWESSGLRFVNLWPRLQAITAYDVVCIDQATATDRFEAIRGMLTAGGK